MERKEYLWKEDSLVALRAFQPRSWLSDCADAFNVLNRANYDEIYTVYGFPLFLGPVPHHYGDGVTSPGNPFFGTPRTALNPRQFQFAAKFMF